MGSKSNCVICEIARSQFAIFAKIANFYFRKLVLNNSAGIRKKWILKKLNCVICEIVFFSQSQFRNYRNFRNPFYNPDNEYSFQNLMFYFNVLF